MTYFCSHKAQLSKADEVKLQKLRHDKIVFDAQVKEYHLMVYGLSVWVVLGIEGGVFYAYRLTHTGDLAKSNLVLANELFQLKKTVPHANKEHKFLRMGQLEYQGRAKL